MKLLSRRVSPPAHPLGMLQGTAEASSNSRRHRGELLLSRSGGDLGGYIYSQ
jgi:hypothetical protein